MTLKMMLVIRNDLNMRKGKLAAQAAHAAQEAILDRTGETPRLKTDPLTLAWLASDYRKVTVRVDSEAELLALVEAAKARGINIHLVEDLGHTEFHGVKTKTAAALGPAEADALDALTGSLKLL